MSFPINMVWFDLDDTLYDHSYAVVCAMERIRVRYPVFSKYEPRELTIVYNQALNAVHPDYLRGNIDLSEMRRRVIERFYGGVGIGVREAPGHKEFRQIYSEAYGRGRRATPGSIEAVEHLKQRGVAVAVLTNGTQADQEDKLRTIGFESLVPCLLTSELAGKTKPDPGIFAWALAQTRRRARNVLMIGDSLENDVEPALGVGISAVHYAPSAPTREVNTKHGSAPVISEWGHLASFLDAAQRDGGAQ
ncbi:MAG: HAD family hydrolase [Terriglobia bacterium]